ncbi:hypothetical protein [Streptomyces sp. NPDC018347]|uniref:hypothetical protein n=1 Tax=Streptomyces sp. NPDC018347 TaxID=3157193 RepID=UPI0033F2C726
MALWAGTRIVVPDGIDVDVRGFGLFGLFGLFGVFGGRAARRAPRVVTKGPALFGVVVIKPRRQAR